MAWIESHQGLERHPKTLKLSSLMSWDIDQTIGKLLRLWWWCLDYAPDGNITRHSPDIVARAISLDPEVGEKLLSSLYESEFLDKTTTPGQLLVHDWLDYSATYLRDTKYRRDPEKYKAIKDLYKTTIARQSPDNRPKRSRKSAVPTNQPNQPNQPTNQVVSEETKSVRDKDFVFTLPDWIDLDTWTRFVEMRKTIKRPMTEYAKYLMGKHLEKLRDQGNDPNACINQSTRLNWQDIYPTKGEANGTNKFSNQSRTRENTIGIQPAQGEYEGRKPFMVLRNG